jgi:hypothetical protein
MKRRELDRLLGRGRLSRPEKEAIFEAALPRPPRRRWLVWMGAPAAAALAALVLVVVRPSDGGFRVKGGADRAVVAASCGGACTRASTIMFRVDELREPAWLAAYATAPSGERIWFFPTDAGEAPQLEPTAAPSVVPRGVRLGEERPAGRYRVVLVLLRHPPSRDEVDRAGDVITRSEMVLEVGP